MTSDWFGVGTCRTSAAVGGLTAALAVGAAASAGPPPIFSNPAASVSGPTGDQVVNALSVAPGDLNGDGAQDALAATDEGAVVLLNNGAGVLEFDADLSRPLASGIGLALADLDGDGDNDAIIAQQDPAPAVVTQLNQGDGTFGPPMKQLLKNAPRTVRIADLNSDGHPDAVAASDGGFAALLGDGSGGLGGSAFFDAGSDFESLTIGDADGDGAPDALLGTTAMHQSQETSGVWLRRGDGAGGFEQLELLAEEQVSPEQIILADATDDRAADIVTASSDLQSPSREFFSPARVYSGLGAGVFDEPIVVNFDENSTNLSPGLFLPFEHPFHGLAVGDFNHDGRSDLAVMGSAGESLVAAFAAGQQGGGFAPAGRALFSPLPDPFFVKEVQGQQPNPTPIGFLQDLTNELSKVDLDNDGAPDLLARSGSGVVVSLLNPGQGFFPRPARIALGSNLIRLADMDNDGDKDMVSVTGVVRVWMNNGFGQYLKYDPSSISLGLIDEARSAAIADFDGDGNQDVAATTSVGLSFGETAIAFGIGNGAFKEVLLINDGGVSIRKGRMNGDQASDLVFIQRGFETLRATTLLNNGAGEFPESQTAVLPDTEQKDQVMGMVAADLNGDGLDDAALSLTSNSDRVRVLLNQGEGALVQSQSFGVDDLLFSIDAGDIDGDGDTDLVVGRFDLGAQIFFNQGGGEFVDGGAVNVEGPMFTMRLADFDGDRELDLLGGAGLDTVRLLLGAGDGSFGSPTGYVGFNHELLPADIDGDGDLDGVTVEAAQPGFPGGIELGDEVIVLRNRTSPGKTIPVDMNGDGVVDGGDLGALLGLWGACEFGQGACEGDFNGDFVVDAGDLAILLGAWGPTGGP